MNIDHIGIVVRSIENGVKQWVEMFGYSPASKMIINIRQKVRIMFLQKKGSIKIKLIEPTSEKSPIFAFAQKGGGLHHLCFKCDRVENEILFLKGCGARCIVKPEPGEAFGNNCIAFLLAGNNLNIELIDSDPSLLSEDR
jgi:methylmalonyl-CoA/ethylmalonyl-CoA epimerase